MLLEPEFDTMAFETDDARFAHEIGLEEFRAQLAAASVLVVPGGNPYKLLKQLNTKRGQEVWRLITEKLVTGQLLYISRSAGTIGAGACIDVTPEFEPVRGMSNNGLDMSALQELDSDLADVLMQGLKMEVLSWKLVKERCQLTKFWNGKLSVP